jgi:hypothetical protein
MKRIRAVAAIGLMLVATAVGAASPASADPAKPDFATQARDAGLTSAQTASLQQRVDAYLARTGGTQVAINKIDLDGKGVLLLALPGEKRAHEIAAGSQPNASIFDCSKFNFCAYSATNYSGDLIKYYSCKYTVSMPFAGYGSYLNDQTQGTDAHFYDSTGAYMYDSLSAPWSSPTFNWGFVYWIKPCGAI